MKKLLCLFRTIASVSGSGQTDENDTIYGLKVDDIDGNEVCLDIYEGKVLLVVNVASRCGFTKQYEGLEKLYQRYKDQGLVVLGFPANNFMWQEPGTNQQIKTFCSTRYHVTFPIFSKISVRGRRCSPLYKWLVSWSDTKKPVEWNFVKFLVNRNGQVVARFGPATKPEDELLVRAIQDAISLYV